MAPKAFLSCKTPFLFGNASVIKGNMQENFVNFVFLAPRKLLKGLFLFALSFLIFPCALLLDVTTRYMSSYHINFLLPYIFKGCLYLYSYNSCHKKIQQNSSFILRKRFHKLQKS